MSDLIELPVHPVSSPIHSLNDDILLHIFTSNADMFSEGDALHTTRVTSQVCQLWRNSMLDTSFLWARLIDLDRIHSDWKHEWRIELIRRSGAAPLWIRASSNIYHRRSPLAHPVDDFRDITRFLYDVLRENWYRIQRLNIYCECWVFDLFNTPIFCLPAPQLQEIQIPLVADKLRAEGLSKYDVKPIFADHAPFLRRLSLRAYVVDHRAPWLSHLHVLKINEKYDLHDVLAVLSATSNLRELWIEFLGRKELSASLPTVSLRHLKVLDYDGFPLEGAALLDHIETPLECLLFISCPYVDIRTNYLPIVNTFSRYTQLHLRSRMTDSIYLRYVPNESIALQLGTIDRGIGISISLRGQDIPDISTIILNSVAFPELSCATDVKFFAGGSLQPCFGSFFGCLTSVHTFVTHSKTFSFLMDLENDMNSTNNPSVIFPTLGVINLFTNSPNPDKFAVDANTAIFLLSRLRNGHPIAILDLNVEGMVPFNAPPNLDALADVKGLKVKYKLSLGSFEYLCGSGEPARYIDAV